MDENLKELIRDRYVARLEKHGAGAIDALASGVESRRELRFTMLSEIGISSGDSILDIGCGFGDLYGFLRERNIKTQYTGIDIVPELVDNATKLYPDATFEHRDIDLQPFEKKFDWVICSQVLNFRLPDDSNIPFATTMMKSAFAHATKGAAIDFITNYVDFEEDHLFYYSPMEMFDIAKHITKKVNLRHDYPLYEFCLYLLPDFQGWNQDS